MTQCPVHSLNPNLYCEEVSELIRGPNDQLIFRLPLCSTCPRFRYKTSLPVLPQILIHTSFPTSSKTPSQSNCTCLSKPVQLLKALESLDNNTTPRIKKKKKKKTTMPANNTPAQTTQQTKLNTRKPAWPPANPTSQAARPKYLTSTDGTPLVDIVVVIILAGRNSDPAEFSDLLADGSNGRKD